MWGLSTEGRQQGWEGWWGQEGSSRAGEGGSAAIITKGLWVVAVNEGRVAGHCRGLTAQRFTREGGGIHVRGELLGGRTEVCVGDEGTSHAVITGKHVRPCREQYKSYVHLCLGIGGWNHTSLSNHSAYTPHIIKMCRQVSQNANSGPLSLILLAETVLTDLSCVQWSMDMLFHFICRVSPGIWTNEGGVVDPPCDREVRFRVSHVDWMESCVKV